MLNGLQCTHAIHVQEFTFTCVTRRYTVVANGGHNHQAAATLCGMAGRLTALVVPSPAAMPLTTAALLVAGPQLAGALTSLCFDFAIDDTAELRAATRAVLAVSAGLQRLNLGLATSIGSDGDYTAAEVQAADAAFQHLMRSLPCCQSLCLGACGAVSHQAMGRGLLLRGPDLVSLTLCTGQVDEQVSPDPQCSLHHPDISRHPVGCRLMLHRCCLSAAKFGADSFIEPSSVFCSSCMRTPSFRSSAV